MNSKQNLFRKTPSRTGEYLPIFLLILALILLFGVIFGVLIFCQMSVSLGHTYGFI